MFSGSAVMDKIANKKMITIKRYTAEDAMAWDASKNGTIMLNRQVQGLLIVTGIWKYLDDFFSGSVRSALASKKYEEDDNIRNYNEFI